jgi:hypothetical protein
LERWTVGTENHGQIKKLIFFKKHNDKVSNMTKTTLTEMKFTFNQKQEYEDNVFRLLKALPPGRYIEVAGLTHDEQKFTSAVIATCALMSMHDITIYHRPTRIGKDGPF